MQEKDIPAFPANIPNQPMPERGMTLRDYFAGQALALMTDLGPTEASHHAYRYADAMLYAREAK